MNSPEVTLRQKDNTSKIYGMSPMGVVHLIWAMLELSIVVAVVVVVIYQRRAVSLDASRRKALLMDAHNLLSAYSSREDQMIRDAEAIAILSNVIRQKFATEKGKQIAANIKAEIEGEFGKDADPMLRFAWRMSLRTAASVI